ncbi:MAG: hypothetical protein PWP37_1553 [Thermotogota bacterium]|nr:hypothetical protein [Thermotogota bacterium]MDK2865361.1 hypothetical protein [Thermotogota bacterium]HCZ06445.1 iron dicitrate transport regulator FecR [Thermotogota bacterium]
MTKVEKEINDQRNELEKIYTFMKKKVEKEEIGHFLKDADIVYFVGCGSSYYLGISASRYFTLKTGIETKAIPGGEIVFAESANVSGKLKKAAVLISRSGESTEVVIAAEKFKRMGVPTLGVTLEEESSLARSSDEKLVIPVIEESIVMTKGFSSTLLSLQLLTDRLAGDLNASIYEEILSKVSEQIDAAYEEIIRERLFEGKHYVFLGTGVYEGLARESALKLEEMSLAKTEAYSTFEYRHGPKALVEEGFVITIFRGGEKEERKEEEKLKKELESYGGKVIFREKLTDEPEDAFLRIVFSQILALKIAEKKGVDVERPRNLTKVVVLKN